MIEKMKLESQDVAAHKREELKQIFPSVFTETRNEKGELVESVDFEKLKAAVGEFSDVFESRRERYGKDWPGKKECMKLVQESSIATLNPIREKSVNFDTTENVFIEGDNLEVLKLLQKSYYGKIKLIYIDPPYNTGNEFIYPDDYSESLETYLDYAGLADAKGKRFSTNSTTEGRFHTKWLNMMFPRLYLARNLLRDDGVIFISIDDHEVVNLRSICNEIFGEENFVCSVIWQRVYSPKNSAKYFSEDHDYVLVYAKNIELWEPTLLPRTDEANARYKNPDNDPRGPWKSSDLTARNYYGDGLYEIEGPTGKTFTPGRGRYWRQSNENFKKMQEDNRIWWGPNRDATPSQKRFLSEVKQGIVPQTLWQYSLVGHTQDAKKELLEFVDFENTQNVLNSVKPTKLLRHILKIGTTPDESHIVLDFFAGSAPLAHATIAQNSEDGGNRRFILVQLPEKLVVDEPKMKTISDLGRARIRNFGERLVAERAQAESESKEKLPGLGNERELPDFGFKYLQLDRSNFDVWQRPTVSVTDSELEKQLELSIDHMNPEASKEDVLIELLLKAGFELSVRIEASSIGDSQIFSVSDGALLICLDDEISQGLLDQIVKLDPIQFICLDKAFKGNDQLKANAVQTFAARNQGREKADQIVFRTV